MILLRNYSVLTLLVISVMSLFSCNSGKDGEYHKNDISFIIPSGWEISAEGNARNGNRYVTCQRKSFIPEANSVSITYSSDCTDLVELLNHYMDLDKSILSMIHCELDSITKDVFKDYPGYTCGYRMNVSNIETICTYRCFHINHKNVVITIAQSAEDTTDNKEDIAKLFSELSFQ